MSAAVEPGYALAGLIERFGADIALSDLLVAIAQCERRNDFSAPCGVMFTDAQSKS